MALQNTESSPSRLLRVNQAARYLGIGAKAVRSMVNDGILPHVQLKPGNSPFLLDIRDLDRWVDAQKVRVS